MIPSVLTDAVRRIAPDTPFLTPLRPGTGRLGLAIAGIGLVVEGLHDEAHALLSGRFAGWTRTEDGAAAIRIQVSWLDAPYRDPGLGREEEYRLEDGGLLRGRASVATGLGGPVVEAAVARDPALLGQEIENVLRLVVAGRLLATGGLLLHAGAVAIGPGAVAFPAASGTGKTTLVRELAAAGLEPLGDDMVALLPDAGRWALHAVPFTGERTLRGRSGARPILAVHPLRRGPGPRLEPLTGATAAAALANQALGLALFPEPADTGLATAARIARSVPVERLHRSLGDDAAGLLRTRHGGPK